MENKKGKISLLSLQLSLTFLLTIASPYIAQRVNNIIKRVYKNDNQKLVYNNYYIDTKKRIVTLNDKEINLTTLEYDLLYMFVTNLGKSYSRDEILNIIWGEDYYGADRVVDDLVRRLRKKCPGLNINTIYGYGYRLT